MKTKKCYKCKQELSLSCFTKSKAKKDGLNGTCRECHKKYTRQHYNNNKSYYKNKAKKARKAYKQEIHTFLAEYFKTHPCVDCGETNFMVLEFDHKDPHTKYMSICSMITGQKPIGLVKKEIQKCEVRCANCHKIKTAHQLGWWKSSYDDNNEQIT